MSLGYRHTIYSGDSNTGTEPVALLWFLFSAYIHCLSSLGILKRNGVKNSATSHPSCRLLPRHLFLTELN